MTKKTPEAAEPKSEAVEIPADKCAYCGADIPADGGVTAGDGNQEITCCSWRHLHWYLVETFTKGKHIEHGMA